jgi:hypothetical protein
VKRTTVLVAYDDAELLDISCVSTTLATIAPFGAAPPYEVRLLSRGGAPISCRPGLTLQAHGALERFTEPVDTVVVVGGFGCDRAAADPVLLAHVRRLARDARRVASVCTGATGRRARTGPRRGARGRRPRGRSPTAALPRTTGGPCEAAPAALPGRRSDPELAAHAASGPAVEATLGLAAAQRA